MMNVSVDTFASTHVIASRQCHSRLGMHNKIYIYLYCTVSFKKSCNKEHAVASVYMYRILKEAI